MPNQVKDKNEDDNDVRVECTARPILSDEIQIIMEVLICFGLAPMSPCQCT